MHRAPYERERGFKAFLRSSAILLSLLSLFHNPCGLQISLLLGNASFQTPRAKGILQSVLRNGNQ